VNPERMENDGREVNFHTTHWSLVLAAAYRNQAPEGRTALAELCRAYWYPLYAHVRRRGFDPEDARDLTQSFFLHLIEHEALTRVDSRKGKFRSFLLASLNNFLSVAHRHDNAIKRGGGHELLSLDVADAEGRYRFEPADQLSAEQTFDARWALSLLNESMRQLEEQYGENSQTFKVLQTFMLPGSETVSYEEAAATLGVSIPAVKTLIYRLRQQYTTFLRKEVARTLADPADIDAEISYLCQVLVKAFGQL
jgi:RNA polymerase sigma factor (sigma-70 family)